MANDIPDWVTGSPSNSAPSVAGPAVITAAAGTFDGSSFTPVSYLLYGYSISAMLRGGVLGADVAVCNVWLVTDAGTYPVVSGIVSTGQPLNLAVMFDQPWVLPAAARAGLWKIRIGNGAIIGTATMDAIAYAWLV